MYKLLGCGVFLFFSLQAQSQNVASGFIKNAKDSTALVGAVVHMIGGKNVTITDVLGFFRLQTNNISNPILLIEYLGFQDKKVALDSIQNKLSINIFLKEKSVWIDSVIIRATRSQENTTPSFVIVDKEFFKKQNFGQDIPILLQWTPSAVTTSDAGAGVGYTSLRIRGIDATGINVTINGIPYNDSESQNTYWVNIPDVASSTQNIHVQRGVGSSTNGVGAFGASINLQTNSLCTIPYVSLDLGGGSFRTQRYSLLAGTGLINDCWTLDVKASKIFSDGYVDRASSTLDGYYLSGGYYKKKTLIKAIVFGGKEKTYQAWNGVDATTLSTHRTMNYAGAIYSADGKSINRYYNNQIDNYQQNHLQVHASQQLSLVWNVNLSLHYTHGSGYYEEYHQNEKFEAIGLPAIHVNGIEIDQSDLIIRKWLNNKFYGATWSMNYVKNKTDLIFGGAYNQYSPAKHFGEIIAGQYVGNQIRTGYHYYEGESKKRDFNSYIKWNYNLSNRFTIFLDGQYRYVDYRTIGINDRQTAYLINESFHFFNPKATLNFQIIKNSVVYGFYSVAHREPNRTDYLNNSTKPKAEILQNIELGWRHKEAQHTFEINYYYMYYVNQLVLTGKLDNVGNPIRSNIGKSFRTGIELSAMIPIKNRLNWNVNLTSSINKNLDFVVEPNGLYNTKTTAIILSPQVIAGSQLDYLMFKNVQIAWFSKYVGKQFLDNTEQENLSLPSYWINDLRVNYQLRIKPIKEIGLSMLINNLFDVMYSSNGYVADNVPYYFPQAGINFLIKLTVKL